MLYELWRMLTDPNYGLSSAQIKALQKLDRSFQESEQKRHEGISQAYASGQPVDAYALSCIEQENNEQYSYMVWFIRNHPNQIRDDGSFKTIYYENNMPSRMA